MAELVTATASRGRLLTRRRLAWFAAAVVVVALTTAYVLLAVVAHPLVAGNAEGVNGGVLQQEVNSNPGTQIRVLDYVDGKTVTIFKWLGNTGPVGLTLTGVDTAPPDWRGLIGIRDARAVPVVESQGCCRYNDPAPWAAPSFQPVVVEPGRQGAVILHILLSNCEYSSGGGTVGLSSIRVHYSVLGTPRVEDIPFFNSVRVKVPDTCPRIAPATPSP